MNLITLACAAWCVLAAALAAMANRRGPSRYLAGSQVTESCRDTA